MPRYRFHLEGPTSCLLDGEGAIVRGPDDAFGACLRAVAGIASATRAMIQEDAAHWHIVVVDRDRGTQLRIGVGDVWAYAFSLPWAGPAETAPAH